MKEVLYVLLPLYADHEYPLLAGSLSSDVAGLRECPQYVNRVVAPTLAPVLSAAGFRTLPDYSFDTMPREYAALVLVGGYGWKEPGTGVLSSIVSKAIKGGRIVGAICNAVSWMASQGFLNDVRHTGNGLEQLKSRGGSSYTNEAGYVNEQVVSDGRIVTANGTGHLEFARELLTLLQNDSPARMEMYYRLMKQGLVSLAAPRPRFSCNTIGLFTEDNAPMVAFYRDVFGFSTSWNGEPNVEMTLGDFRLIMFPRTKFEAMVNRRFSYPVGHNGTMELSMDVPTFADVDEEYARAVRMGGQPVFPPTTEPWGQRTCYVADPDGNLIEISSFVEK